jgi:hypothetical protein
MLADVRIKPLRPRGEADKIAYGHGAGLAARPNTGSSLDTTPDGYRLPARTKMNKTDKTGSFI